MISHYVLYISLVDSLKRKKYNKKTFLFKKNKTHESFNQINRSILCMVLVLRRTCDVSYLVVSAHFLIPQAMFFSFT